MIAFSERIFGIQVDKEEEPRIHLRRQRLGPILLEFTAFRLNKYYNGRKEFLWDQDVSFDCFLEGLFNHVEQSFTRKWGNGHQCRLKGCGWCVIFDANHKCKSPTCANPDCVTPLDLLGVYSINIGCSNQPEYRSHLCIECNEKLKHQIALGVKTYDKSTSKRNNNIKNNDNSNDKSSSNQNSNVNASDAINEYNEQDLPQNMYLMEKILQYDGSASPKKYLIKWLNYDESENTWEPAKHIPLKWRKMFHANNDQPLQIWKPNETEILKKTSKTQDEDISEEKSNLDCNTDKEKVKDDDREFVKQKRMIGVGTMCWPCGIIFYVGLFYRSESIMQWIRHLSLVVQWCGWMTQPWRQNLTLIYDDACHLAGVLRNPKRKNCHPIWTWLANLRIFLDRIHTVNHVEQCREIFGMTKDMVEFHLVNTEVCESLYRWLSSFKHVVCNMTQLHMKWFLLNICHQRNIEVAKAIRQSKANVGLIE